MAAAQRSFEEQLAFHKNVGGKSVGLVTMPKAPTLDEVQAWQKAKNAGKFTYLLQPESNEVAQIKWERVVDHALFSRWMKLRARDQQRTG